MTLSNQQHTHSEEQVSTRLITIGGAASFLIGAIGFLVMANQTNTWQYLVMGATGVVLAILLGVGYLLNERKRTKLAVWIALIGGALAFVVYSLFSTGLAVILAVIMLILGINVSIQIFQGQDRALGFLASIIGMILIIVAGANDFGIERIATELWLQEVLLIASGLLGMLLFINTLRRFEFNTLRTQLILAFLVIALVPILLIEIPQMLSIQGALREETDLNLTENAINASYVLEQKLLHVQDLITTATKLPTIQVYLSNETGASRAVLVNTLNSLKGDSSYILSYAILNAAGLNIADTQAERIGEDESNASYFLSNLVRRRPYISDVFYAPGQGDAGMYFYISAPIFNDENTVIGVLRAQVGGRLIQDTLETLSDNLGGDHAIILIEQHDIILGHSQAPELRMRTVTAIDESLLRSLQANGQLPTGSPEMLSANLDTLASNMGTLSEKPYFESTIVPNSTDNRIATGKSLTLKPWLLIIASSAEAVSTTINQQIVNAALISIVIMIAVIVAASITSTFITSPMGYLVQMAEQIGAGDLSLRTNLTRRDELGGLSKAIDNATDQLQQLLSSMENRIAERTDELAQANKNNEKRALQLQAVADVARAVTSLQDPEHLLPIIVERVSQEFGFYHVGIFLIEQSGTYAILRAANSAGGLRMLERKHRLRVGQVGIVGYVTSSGRPRIALDVGEDATYFNNPDLPDTRSEMALPLKIGNKIIGALDAQSTEPAAFTDDDISILSLLADQLSIAIQNARMFEETRQALTETRTLYSETVRESWKQLTKDIISGYRYNNGRIQPIIENIARPVAANQLEIPVISRGELFGNIRIRLPIEQAEATSEEDLKLYEAIAERLALALDNARLVDESQKRAEVQKAIANMTGKIGSSTDVDTILQSTVEELGQLIADTEVIIQLNKSSTD